MVNMNNKTLKEFDVSNVTYQSLFIDYLEFDVAFELKYGLIHMLCTLCDLANEDPYKHLKEFHVMCSTMKP